jgi:putative membrane protein
MVKDHQKDISEFKKGETSAQKPDVKQFAQKTLPTLQSHLELAQHMQAHVTKEGMSKGKASGGSSQK